MFCSVTMKTFATCEIAVRLIMRRYSCWNLGGFEVFSLKSHIKQAIRSQELVYHSILTRLSAEYARRANDIYAPPDLTQHWTKKWILLVNNIYRPTCAQSKQQRWFLLDFDPELHTIKIIPNQSRTLAMFIWWSSRLLLEAEVGIATQKKGCCQTAPAS